MHFFSLKLVVEKQNKTKSFLCHCQTEVRKYVRTKRKISQAKNTISTIDFFWYISNQLQIQCLSVSPKQDRNFSITKARCWVKTALKSAKVVQIKRIIMYQNSPKFPPKIKKSVAPQIASQFTRSMNNWGQDFYQYF